MTISFQTKQVINHIAARLGAVWGQVANCPQLQAALGLSLVGAAQALEEHAASMAQLGRTIRDVITKYGLSGKSGKSTLQ